MDETEPALKPETNTERWLMAMQVVDTAPVAAACDSRFGWYPKAAMNQLRRLMKKNLQQFLLDAGIKTNIDEYVKSTGKLRTDWMGSADLKSALKTTRLAAGGGADEEEEQGEDEDDDEEEEEEEEDDDEEEEDAAEDADAIKVATAGLGVSTLDFGSVAYLQGVRLPGPAARVRSHYRFGKHRHRLF
jgi:hypothetical protein